jgi:hypothetical protein
MTYMFRVVGVFALVLSSHVGELPFVRSRPPQHVVRDTLL